MRFANLRMIQGTLVRERKNKKDANDSLDVSVRCQGRCCKVALFAIFACALSRSEVMRANGHQCLQVLLKEDMYPHAVWVANGVKNRSLVRRLLHHQFAHCLCYRLIIRALPHLPQQCDLQRFGSSTTNGRRQQANMQGLYAKMQSPWWYAED